MTKKQWAIMVRALAHLRDAMDELEGLRNDDCGNQAGTIKGALDSFVEISDELAFMIADVAIDHQRQQRATVRRPRAA